MTRRCRSCTKNQYPNFVLVYVIDEDSSWRSRENGFLSSTGNDSSPFLYEEDATAVEDQPVPAGAIREFAKYIDDLGFDGGSFGGFLGIVLVPVVHQEGFGQPSSFRHRAMKYRMNVFRDALSEEHRANIIILGEESDPSGVAVIRREDDYSERLITAIETLRLSDDQEELLDLHYIINMIDDSGSHLLREFDPTWGNYFRYYTPPLADGTNPAVDLFDSLTAGDFELTILDTLLRPGNGSNWETGLAYGIGTRHIVKTTGENWVTSIAGELFYLAAQQNNNWIENCRKLCRYRWTTDVGYWYALFGGVDTTQPQGLLWSQVDPSTNGDNLDVYGIVYNNRENSDDPEDFRFYMRSNFPSDGGFPFTRANDYQTVGSTDSPNRAGFTESPFKDAIYNTNRFRSNCPCYMFDPVRNYFIENLRDIRE